MALDLAIVGEVDPSVAAGVVFDWEDGGEPAHLPSILAVRLNTGFAFLPHLAGAAASATFIGACCFHVAGSSVCFPAFPGACPDGLEVKGIRSAAAVAGEEAPPCPHPAAEVAFGAGGVGVTAAAFEGGGITAAALEGGGITAAAFEGGGITAAAADGALGRGFPFAAVEEGTELVSASAADDVGATLISVAAPVSGVAAVSDAAAEDGSPAAAFCAGALTVANAAAATRCALRAWCRSFSSAVKGPFQRGDGLMFWSDVVAGFQPGIGAATLVPPFGCADAASAEAPGPGGASAGAPGPGGVGEGGWRAAARGVAPKAASSSANVSLRGCAVPDCAGGAGPAAAWFPATRPGAWEVPRPTGLGAWAGREAAAPVFLRVVTEPGKGRGCFGACCTFCVPLGASSIAGCLLIGCLSGDVRVTGGCCDACEAGLHVEQGGEYVF